MTRVESLREREPDEIAHVAALAELRYVQAEILTHTNELTEAAGAARASLDLYRVLRGFDPIHTSDRVRDAKSRLRLLELRLRDGDVPYAERVPLARASASAEPGPDTDHDLGRALARQALDHVGANRRGTALPLLREAIALYRRLRPLGEDDLDLFAEACLRAAQALFDLGSFDEAAQYATDAAQAFGSLATRRPERYDKPWFDARELGARSQTAAESRDI